MSFNRRYNDSGERYIFIMQAAIRAVWPKHPWHFILHYSVYRFTSSTEPALLFMKKRMSHVKIDHRSFLIHRSCNTDSGSNPEPTSSHECHFITWVHLNRFFLAAGRCWICSLIGRLEPVPDFHFPFPCCIRYHEPVEFIFTFSLYSLNKININVIFF
jgi:hypothetical protein